MQKTFLHKRLVFEYPLYIKNPEVPASEQGQAGPELGCSHSLERMHGESLEEGCKERPRLPGSRRAVNRPRTHFSPRSGHQLPIKELPACLPEQSSLYWKCPCWQGRYVTWCLTRWGWGEFHFAAGNPLLAYLSEFF